MSMFGFKSLDSCFAEKSILSVFELEAFVMSHNHARMNTEHRNFIHQQMTVKINSAHCT